MAQPLLSFLSGRARAALPYLRGSAAKGLSAAAAIDILKPLNLTFQRQRMLDVYAALITRIDPERAARLVGQNVPIPQELHKVSPVDLSSNYQYQVGAFDATGEPLGFLTVVSGVPLSATQIHAEAQLKFETDKQLYLENPNATIDSLSITDAYVNGGVPQE